MIEVRFTKANNADLPLSFIENGYKIIEVNLLLTYEKLKKESDTFTWFLTDFHNHNHQNREGHIKRIEAIEGYIRCGSLECPVLKKTSTGSLDIIQGCHRILALKEYYDDNIISNDKISITVALSQANSFQDIQNHD